MTESPPPSAGRRVLRTFVAVEVPGPARAEVRALVEAVAAASPPRAVRWVRPEGLHLTLRFLGPTPVERLAAVGAVVRATAGRHRSFAVEIAGAGAFPTLRRPRVLWLGVAVGGPELAALAADLDRGFEPLGWAPEGRPYAAHLTLARAEPGPGAAETAARLVEAAHGFRFRWEVEDLVLFESILGRGGASYLPLERVPLGVAAASPRGA